MIMDLYTRNDFLNMMKETPAQSLDFLSKKLSEMSAAVRSSQSGSETQKIIDELIFTQKYFIAEIIDNADRLSSLQSAALPDLIDLEKFDPAS